MAHSILFSHHLSEQQWDSVAQKPAHGSQKLVFGKERKQGHARGHGLATGHVTARGHCA